MTKARWIGKGRLAWQRAHTSLWFLPALLVGAAVTLSTVLLRVDATLGTRDEGGWWVFGGSAGGARTVLSVIAGSLITVVSVAFSVTMIAIQQASTQFSPRLLRNFTRDRGNQLVLGMYIATFTYALLVLRRVREGGADGGEFVPSIAISTAMLLALVSLGLLVYFIHHVSEALQISTLLSVVRHDLKGELARLFPETIGVEEEEPADFATMTARFAAARQGHETIVTSDEEGYLRRIDEDELAVAAEGARFVCVEVQLGEYLRPGDIILRAWSDRPPGDKFGERVVGAFQLDRDRSLEQDPLFGIRQLVDIAVKALSPGVNDPTTAEQALDHLGGAMAVLLHRAIPSPVRMLGGTRFVFRAPTVTDYVDSAFAQIRRAARTDLHVSLYLIEILRKLIEQTASAARAAPLRRQLEEVVAGFEQEMLTDAERALLRRGLEPRR